MGASLRHYPVLRCVSLVSPLWTLGTFVVSIGHIVWHGLIIEREQSIGPATANRVVSVQAHDRTVRILFLPVLYGLMSLQGVVQMWGVTVNRSGSCRHHFRA